jgi:hypothetical protein
MPARGTISIVTAWCQCNTSEPELRPAAGAAARAAGRRRGIQATGTGTQAQAIVTFAWYESLRSDSESEAAVRIFIFPARARPGGESYRVGTQAPTQAALRPRRPSRAGP